MALAFVLWHSVVYFASIMSSTQAIECQGTARYTITFRAEWTSQSHQDFPSSPHFSSLVGCSHNASYVMWEPGIKATRGVKNVAEFGSSSALINEMDRQINSKNAHKRYISSGISSTGTRSISNIEVTSKYPLVSFITMIAPSPDWFVGVHDFDLCDTTTGKWLDSRARDLPPYDAGTDSGPRFTSLNDATNPPEDIHLLTNNTEGSFKGDKPVRRFGTFTFVKTYDSNPIIKPSSTMQQRQPSTSVNARSSTIMIDPKESSTPISTIQKIQPSSSVVIDPKGSSTLTSTMHKIQPTSSIIIDPKGSSTPISTMQQIQPSSSVIIDPKESSSPISTMQQIQPSSSIIIDPKGSSTPYSNMQQIQPSASVNIKSSIIIHSKESSTQQVDMKNTPSTKANVAATQTLNPTATITASASVQMTPTFTTTNAACSVKQFSFIYVIFATILVSFCFIRF